MKPVLKSFTSCLLVIALALGALPVHAATTPIPRTQVPVSIERVYGVSFSNGAYTFTIDWHEPPLSPNLHGAADPNSTNHVEFVQTYQFYYVNATRNEQLPGILRGDRPGNATTANPNALYTHQFPGIQLDRNSIYEFNVFPARYNMRRVVGINIDMEEPILAPIDRSPNVRPERNLLFLTNIDVRATATVDTVTVRWHNPTYRGISIFEEYDIYYYRLQSGPIPVTNPNFQRRVAVRDTTFVRDGPDAGMIEYTFATTPLEVGEYYAIKVEPRAVRNGIMQSVRGVNNPAGTVDRITVGGVEFLLAYTRGLDGGDQVEYRYNDMYVKPALSVTPQGGGYALLHWTSLGERGSTAQTPTHITLMASETRDGHFNSIGTIQGTSAVYEINTWRDRPPGPMYYKMVIHYPGGRTIESEIVYYDPSYNDFTPYRPLIRSAVPTIQGNRPLLNIYWNVFLRPPYNEQEEQDSTTRWNPAGDLQYVDSNVWYDIYITDDIENFNDPLFTPWTVTSLRGSQLPFGPLRPLTDPNRNPVYHNPAGFSQYVSKNPVNGAYERHDRLLDNKVYYIRIVAIRDTPAGQESEPAYYSVFIPPSGPLTLDPNMLSSPPLRLKRDVHGAEIVTEDAYHITWDTKYFEIYDPATQTWHAQFGRDENNNLVFGRDASFPPDTWGGPWVLNDIFHPANPSFFGVVDDSVRDRFKLFMLNQNITPPPLMGAGFDLITIRLMDLTGVSYEIHTVTFDEMMAVGELFGATDTESAYHIYHQRRLAGRDNPAWEDLGALLPASATLINIDHIVRTVHAPAAEAGALKPNTAYVTFLRPYIRDTAGEKFIAHYPAYVMATTQDDRPPLPVTPTVPRPEVVDVTDTTVTLRWRFQGPLMEFDLRYSARLGDYFTGGTLIPWEVIWEGNEFMSPYTLEADPVTGEWYMHFTVTRLFPDTEYFFWILARDSVSGQESNSWSNPVSGRTHDIVAPEPPRGLGLAGRGLINEYNRMNGTQFAPSAADALIIQWILNEFDPLSGTPEVGGGIGGASEIFGALNIDADTLAIEGLFDMFTVRFSNLIANRAYFVRAKTVLTVTRDGDAGSVRLYSYVIQFSPDEEFRDYIEFVIPPMSLLSALDPLFTRRKESAWTPILRFMTGYSGDEYDGDRRPDQYPLPEQDFELTYDRLTETLGFRFRSDQRDAQGIRDQNADQRFISTLVALRTFVYTINLTQYSNRIVQNGYVDIPYSIVRALHERQIALELILDNVRVTFTPGSLATAEVRAMAGVDTSGMVRLSIDNGRSSAPVLRSGESYVSAPRRVTARVSTSSRSINIENFAASVGLSFRLDSRVTPMEQNIGLFTATSNTGGWSRVNAQHHAASGELRFNTTRAGNFAGIATASAQPSWADPTRDAYVNVTARVAITDMPFYNAQSIVSVNMFNNLVAAFAMGRNTVSVAAPLSAADIDTLQKARMYVPGPVITREAAMDALVTLYELQARRTIQVWGTGPPDIQSAASGFRNAVIKAGEIGFYTGNARPDDTLTMGELMTMLNVIIMDAY
jgi:hypothetical protein